LAHGQHGLLPTDTMPTPASLFEKGFIFKIGQETAAKSEFYKHTGNEGWFYFFCLLALYLGLFKIFYQKYFSTLFKVFFNSSLKQSQLTDQLQQSKLPSLLLNVFFSLTAGTFIFLLIKHGGHTPKMNWLYAVYITKMIVLKVTGLVSGLEEQTDTYIFIIFLINKVTGILLLPLTIGMVFSPAALKPLCLWMAVFCTGILFLLRYYRSYGLLQHKLRVSPFHFALFIIGVEILPLLVIYKAVVVFLVKNL
jgi:hypothetical protein